MARALIRDLAFWPSLGALIGVGSYLVAATPFWLTVGMHAAMFLGLGMVIYAARRTQ